MSKRDDMIAALMGGIPSGAVPLWELEFHAWDTFADTPLVLGEVFASLTPGEQERALYANAETMLMVAELLGFAAITVPGNYWQVAPGVLAYYVLPGEARYQQIRVLQKLKPEDLMLVAVSGGVMSMPSADEYVQFCYQLYDAPEEIDQRAQNDLRAGLKNAQRLRDLGIETVVTASDIADNHGPFFNPQQSERYIWPYLREWAESVRQMGLFGILHSDGDLMPYLEIIASTGIHALQAIDPVAGMDIAAVKAKVGDQLCLCGNIDCGLLITGTKEEISYATHRLLTQCMSDGSFVLGASNAVQMEVPKENYLAMISTLRSEGRY